MWWLGVFIAPPTKMAVGEAVCRWAHRIVRCASHVTQPLGFDRWSSDSLGHRTVQCRTGHALFIVRCAFWRCFDSTRTVHALQRFCRCPLESTVALEPLLRWHTGQFGDPPDSPMNYSVERLANSREWLVRLHLTVSGVPLGSTLLCLAPNFVCISN